MMNIHLTDFNIIFISSTIYTTVYRIESVFIYPLFNIRSLIRQNGHILLFISIMIYIQSD